MLRRVLATRAKLLGDAHVATGEAKYALGLLHLFNGTDLNEARELVKDAAQTYSKHLGAGPRENKGCGRCPTTHPGGDAHGERA